MDQSLQNKKVAVLVDNGFEEVEFTKPIEALKNAGATVVVVSPQKGKVKAWATTDWGNEYDVDMDVADARAENFAGLVLPGGVMNPDKLRMNEDAVALATAFFEQGKPIAAICHGPWLLVETGALEGRTVTSYPSIKTDLINAGADWVDKEVVTDEGITTSRKPDDLPAFCKKMIEELKEGKHSRQNS
ncbi:type 1 glutamine amidotransferase domain-containing protein [soil metagenome]